MRSLKPYFPVFFLVVSAVLCLFLIKDSQTNQRVKRDYAELNHVYYGLFSVSEWKARLSQIVSSELDDFYIANEQGAKFKEILEGQLRILIDKIYQRIERENSKSAKGFFRQTVLESLVDVREIKAGVPEYADAMVRELSRRENQDAIKAMLKQRLSDYFKKTYQEKETAEVRRILKETSSKNVEEGIGQINHLFATKPKYHLPFLKGPTASLL